MRQIWRGQIERSKGQGGYVREIKARDAKAKEANVTAMEAKIREAPKIE